MAKKKNPAELSSGQSTSKEAIQEIAQTVARELLSELKSTSTQQQDLALPSGMFKLSFGAANAATWQYPCRIKRSKRCSIPAYMYLIGYSTLLFSILAQQTPQPSPSMAVISVASATCIYMYI